MKPEKTRLAHTFDKTLSEDGVAGFDFLGHHIRQYPAGKHRSSLSTHGKILGFNTLITPSKKASKAHLEEIGRIIKKHRSSPQAKLIKDLNPVIRGWTSFYSKSDAKTVGELSKQDYLTYLKLRRWAKCRCGNINAGHKLYWHTIGNNNWVFTTNEEGANPLRLLRHSEFECSSTDYVKVKGDKSPFDGDLVYWSSRMGQNPELPNRMALLLKQQKGKCPVCEYMFKNEDVMEVDHIIPRAIGGKDNYENLQLLHRHCHDVKTKTDLEIIREHNLEIVSQGKKHQTNRKKGKSSNDKKTLEEPCAMKVASTVPNGREKLAIISLDPIRGFCIKNRTWHRAIVPWGYPQSIVAAEAFHDRVREGIGVVPPRNSTRKRSGIVEPPRLHSNK